MLTAYLIWYTNSTITFHDLYTMAVNAPLTALLGGLGYWVSVVYFLRFFKSHVNLFQRNSARHTRFLELRSQFNSYIVSNVRTSWWSPLHSKKSYIWYLY